eukprot:4657331-Prymnesium_polylepis.1
MLADAPGMKRRRSLSSSNSVMLEGTLPALADKFYQVRHVRARASGGRGKGGAARRARRAAAHDGAAPDSGKGRRQGKAVGARPCGRAGRRCTGAAS